VNRSPDTAPPMTMAVILLRLEELISEGRVVTRGTGKPGDPIRYIAVECLETPPEPAPSADAPVRAHRPAHARPHPDVLPVTPPSGDCLPNLAAARAATNAQPEELTRCRNTKKQYS